jgi:type I restriction enzyme S subunit
LGLEHLNQGGFSINSIGESDKLASNKFKFEAGDVLFGKLRPYFKKVYRPKFCGVCSTDIWVIKSKNNQLFDQGFIYYLTASDDFIKKAVESSEGTRMPRASWNFMCEQLFAIPRIYEQKQISSILSTLDAKIELNQESIKTLEELGQTLFEKWFEDFDFPNEKGEPYKSSSGEMVKSELGEIPKDWKICCIDEIAEFQNGFAFYTIGYSDKGLKVVDLLNIDEQGNFKESDRDKFLSLEIANQDRFKKYQLNKDDLVMVMTDMTQNMGILGKCARIRESKKFILNQRICRFRTKTVDTYFLQSYLNSKTINNKLKEVSLGTVQKYFNTSHIKQLKFVIPNKEIMDMYSTLIKPIYLKIDYILDESDHLHKVKNSLLPKLLSGKIRICQ